jgi:hypothetical protein
MGHLPIHTEWGGDYHVVMYHYANYIQVEFAKDCCSKKALAAALQQGLNFFKELGMDSSYTFLDNKFVTAGYRKFFR